MSNRETRTCGEYAEAIFRRSTEPMEPFDFEPNWADQPSRYKIYREVERFALPQPSLSSLVSMAEIMERAQTPPAQPAALTYENLASILLYAHAALDRRLDVHWNMNHKDRVSYAHATFGRGTASGGGMYPTEIFWACGQHGPLLPGIYHYDNGHHAMARLLSGDVTQRIRMALSEHPTALATDQFLLVSLNFWKNSFKYNSFSYHVVTQDLGALLGSLRLLATGFGSDLPIFFWYADEELNQLLGLETLSESVFAVIPFPSAAGQTAPTDDRIHSGLPLSLIQKPAFQRSREILHFPTIQRVHQSALLETDEARPGSRDAYRASCDEFAAQGEKLLLPPPSTELMGDDLLAVFRRRRSSFGRFSSQKALRSEQFATLLHFASVACNYTSDLKSADGSPHFTRIMTFVNHIEGIAQGAYSYDWKRHCLLTVAQQDFSSFLQESYFLQNYNLAEISALMVIVGKPERMLEVYGNRGYRILQAEVGMVAQSVYMASTALSFNCGAALGFDNIAMNKALGLHGSDERSILYLLIGNGLPHNADFVYSLV
jgi:SagB-type dehydrogenase family enzyme